MLTLFYRCPTCGGRKELRGLRHGSPYPIVLECGRRGCADVARLTVTPAS